MSNLGNDVPTNSEGPRTLLILFFVALSHFPSISRARCILDWWRKRAVVVSRQATSLPKRPIRRRRRQGREKRLECL